jgi:hypothetical protein
VREAGRIVVGEEKRLVEKKYITERNGRSS